MRASEFTQPQSAGCIVVAKDTGRWCLQQRSDTVSDPGLWAAWGGGVEPGETLEQCVRRELAEESGYRGPIKLEPLAKNAKYATYIGIVPHEFEPRLNSESQDSCWVHAGDWPSPLHPGLRSALSRLDQGVAEGSIKDLQYDLQDQQWDAIVGYVINGLKKNMDIGRMELNLYKYAGQEMFDVDQELQDRGFKDIADLADHIKQHNGRYVPPTDFGLSDLGKGVAEGLNEADASTVQFRTASTDNYQSSFTVTAIADGKTVGHFSFFRDPETDEVHNQAEVTDDVRGKGYGKALLLKAIEVANDHGLGFQEDSQSLSRAQSRVYDSLYDAGWIVDADGYWFLTPEGEQELSRLSTVQQGVAEGSHDKKSTVTTFVIGCDWNKVVEWLEKNIGQTTLKSPNHINGWYGQGWALFLNPSRYEPGKLAFQVRANTDLSEEELKSQIEMFSKAVAKDDDQINELSPATVLRYAKAVAADAQKHDMDPTKRPAEKRNQSVVGFSRALNRLPKVSFFNKEQDVEESWKISTPIDKERYTDMSDQGLEGPFRLKSGKIVYYDPKEGKYYDRDTDMYMDYDEYQSHTNEEALMELGYEGNVGAMEMVKFFKMADPRQKEILNQLIKEKEFQRAWALIQGVTGDKLVGKEFSEGEIAEQLSEDLRAWFGKGGEGGAGGGGWDRYNTKGERIGKCGERKAGEGKPKCLSKEKAASLRASGGKKAIAAAVRKKRREDPNPQRQGKADMVSNKTKNESLEYYVKEGICPQCNGEMVSEALFTEGKKDACYHKVKSRYKIWPSAYGSGALVKCRKVGAKNWGNKSKNESINEGRADDLERALMQARKITKGIAYDNTVNEIMVEIEKLIKTYNLDMDDFNYHNSRVYEAKHELESAIYGLDEIFEDALRDAKFSDEEGINEADLARRGFLGTLGKAAAAGAAVAAGGKALGQEKRSVNISVDEADSQIKALRNQAYQDLASMMWSVWPYILDKKFGNLTPQDDIPTAEEIGKIISNRIGRKLEEYANEYRKKVHLIKVNAGITDPSRLYKTSAMLESSNKADLSEQDLIVMPGKMRMRGDVVKAKHMEPDHEVSMAVNSLLSTVKSAMSLAKIIKGRSEGQGLPGWVSDHITRADELIKDVAEYMEGHEAQKNMLEGKKNVKR